MEVNKSRAGGRGSVTAGSLWESRMKNDEVRGGIKVSNAEENPEEGGGGGNGGARLKRSPIGVAASAGKRKSWKSGSSEGLNKSPIQVSKGKIEKQKNSEEQCKDKEMSISSADGIKKSPIQTRNVVASADNLERSPIQSRKLRSEKGAEEVGSEGHERSSGQLRKSKSDSAKKNASASGNNSVQLRKTKSELDRVSDESGNGVDGSDGGCDEKIEVEGGKNDADENCKDFDVCQEKVISSSSDNVDVVKCSSELSVQASGDSDHVVVDDEADEEQKQEKEEVVMDEEVEVEMEKDSFDVKEISIPESKVVKEPENKKAVVNEPDKKIVVSEPENKKVVSKEPEKKVVNEPESKKVVNELESKKVVNELESKKVVNEPEPKRIVSAHMRFHHSREKPVSVPHTVKQSPPIRRHSTIYQNFSKANPSPKTEEYHSFPQTQSKLQSLVDLVMWRDVSRSAFVFGMGTFIIVSSSYAKDINVSFISVMSYIGLVYLAVIFLYRSLICRGVIDVEDSNYVLGEEEAIWLLKFILPYLNEFLLKLKALFSGDPGTTIKLAVLLFVLARCGSSITIWKTAKFGFFGVFTVPKICSSYSAQLTAYANFWIRRFRDAWDSCSHKKAVALGIFGLVWNMSSVVARIWAVFVLFVAFRYYQQHYLVRDEWMEDEGGCDETWQDPVGVGARQQQGPAANPVDINKVKKGF